MRQRRRRLVSEFLEPRRVLDSTVVFNEIMYHPQDEGENLEFVELYNQMGVDMDISRWSLAEGIEYTFPEGTIVPTGGYLVVSRDPTALLEATGIVSLGPFSGRLANDGETIELRDRNARRMDQITYDDDQDWPVAADGSGASLAKADRNTATDAVENWRSSIVVGGTPGLPNSADQIAVQPEDVFRTLVSEDAVWRFDASGRDLGSSWLAAGFDDSGWSSGPGAFFAGSAKLDGDAPGAAEGVVAAASSALTGHEAVHTVDGSGLNGNAHITAPTVGSMWLSKGIFIGESDVEPEITFDLGTEALVSAIKVWNFNGVDDENCCLDRGIAKADILVAGDDGVFSTLIQGQEFDRAPGTESDFSQTIDLGGANARYIKIDVDTTNGVAGHGDSLSIVGLSEVQVLTFPPPGETRLPLGPSTFYFRHEFNFADAPQRTELFLSGLFDDGAVVYLNGVEVQRVNMPAGVVNADTPAVLPIGDATPLDTISIPADHLVNGRNVLAVEVHQASEDDSDMVFGLELASVTAPAPAINFDTVEIAINEVAAATADEFFVELYNFGDESVDLTDMRLALSSGAEHRFAAGTSLGPSQYLLVSPVAASPQDGDRLFLYSSDGTLVVSSAEVASSPRARQPAGTGVFLVPQQTTPGQPNAFQLRDEIVINEIMYHHRSDTPTPGEPADFEETRVVEFDSVWRFNPSGDQLSADWASSSHPVGGNWLSGPGLLGFESGSVVAPGIMTEIDDNDVVTYYFERDFELTAQQLAETDSLLLRHIIDDGAVFYLNGHEVLRFMMPEGPIDAMTTASGSVNNAVASDPLSIDASLLVEGTNRISVEVHQRSATSNDVLFGTQLSIANAVKPAVPPSLYQANDEEWIELFNRSNSTVDLSGWALSDAVRYEFPTGTRLDPQQYLVVARDPVSLRAKHPQVAEQIIGGFSGGLNNQTDRIRLLDSLGNPADVVHYYDSGQWPKAADGRGSSLELRDPDADNSQGLAWAASDESSRSAWRTYSYQGVAKASSIGQDSQWSEFILGLLSDGEVLLDDISVIQDPSGEPVELIQNGSFESDPNGGEPASWRIIGNHRHSEIITDPEDASNQVLRLVATGATEHMHNHAETTLKHGDEIARLRNGTEYRITYRAKWISGTNLLNSRLYFNRLARTNSIDQPSVHGTPGTQNSSFENNLGPTYRNLAHAPVVPAPGQPVTVSVDARDNDDVAELTLWYSVDSGQWQQIPMVEQGGDRFTAQLPGLPAGTITQFYVQGTDGLGAATTFPRDGRDSRALVQVDDGRATDVGLHNFRLIVTPDDAEFLHDEVELMSNDDVGLTVVYNESQVFYDAGVRLSGSQRARPFQPRLSFALNFDSDNLFRGVHGSLILDRSESTGFGQREHLYHHGMNHAGGLPTEYNDLFHIITPRPEHTGGAEAQLARLSDLYLDEQYERGSEGQVFEYELVYYPTTTIDRGNPEARKRPQPDTVSGVNISDLGDSKEDYRWAFLNKNNRQQDDYSRLIEFAAAMGQPSTEFNETIDQFIDVDQWLRTFAYGAITGHGDNYTSSGSQHNLQLYVRPSDNLVLQMPHDLDAFFNVSQALVGPAHLRTLLRIPEREHMYYGHVHDMIQTTFNEEYMGRWADHWGQLLPAQPFDRHLRDMQRRSDFLMNRIERAAPPVEFQITTPPMEVDTSQITIAGDGWINVRELRLGDSLVPLDVTWTEVTTWEATVPLVMGENDVVIRAFDFQGELIGTATLPVTSRAANDLSNALRISELNYNPAPPTADELAADPNLDNDQFEFVEFTNVGQQPINLLGVHFADGIEFTFPAVTLRPREYVVVVNDADAFRLRYGDEPRIAGVFADGRLSNQGERLAIVSASGESLFSFTYNDADPWTERADGAGGTLVVNDPANTPPDQLSKYYRWRGSTEMGGSPGSDALPAPGVVINEVLNRTNPPEIDAIELFNPTADAIDIGGWWLSDSANRPQKFRIPDGTLIAPGGHVVFDETDFNASMGQSPQDFALSGADGDDVWLVVADESGIRSFVDDVHFPAAAVGESFGRDELARGRLTPQRSPTLGNQNAEPRVGPLVISEVNYNPSAPSDAALSIDPSLTAGDLEFFEIYNSTNEPIPLTNWRIRGGVEFDFAVGTLSPHEALMVVKFDPQESANSNRVEAIRTHYGLGQQTRIVGGFTGGLDNDIDQLVLQQRDTTPGVDGVYLIGDEVIYDDVAPWPGEPDGGGSTLTRVATNAAGNRPASWQAAAPSPGQVGLPADLTGDGVVNVEDVDHLCTGIRRGDLSVDVNGDGVVDRADLTHLVETLIGTSYGDANLDRIFDARDIDAVVRAGEFEDDVSDNSTWADGDWNCDGDFDSADLVLAFRSDGFVAAARQVSLSAEVARDVAAALAGERHASEAPQKKDVGTSPDQYLQRLNDKTRRREITL